MTFERWHVTYLEGPGAMPDACIVALVGDGVVGYTGLRRRGSASPTAGLLTAVRRPWRRRGIATTPQARADCAGEGRVEQIYTTNDEDERRHARRQRAPRIPSGAHAHPRQRAPGYVMSRRLVIRRQGAERRRRPPRSAMRC